MSGRCTDQLLDELGTSLDRAWRAGARRRRRLPRLGRRGAVAALAAALALVPTAVGTRNALWAPDPPPLPSQLRPRDAVAPGAAGTPVYIAQGSRDGVAFRLSATACRYGSVSAVGLFLTVPGGGAGARCDVAARRPGASPGALAARRVQTYYDPVSERTWVFGTLPADAATVTVASRAYAAAPVDPDAIEQGHLPAGMRTFVVALPGVPDVTRVRVADAHGTTILTCLRGRCDR